MRKPLSHLEQWSVISFEDYGTAHARFDMLSSSHGTGDSYAWPAADGKRAYSVKRSDEVEIIDGWPINNWELTVAIEGGSVRHINVACIRRAIYDLDAPDQSATHQMHNEVYRATEDAFTEREVKDREVPYFDAGYGIYVANATYGLGQDA